MRRSVASALAALAALTALGPARADRLHLESGAVLETSGWWIEGDTIHYESGAGIVGLPRSLVVRIEPSSGGRAATPARRPPEPALQPRTAKRPGETGPPASGRKVPKDVAVALEQGAAALERREYEIALDRFRTVLRVVPDLSRARVGGALAALALGRDQEALPFVLDGLGLDPRSADLHELLGDLRDREERVDDALEAWREAFRLEPGDRLRDKILKAERELHAGREYAFTAAAHFNLRFDGEVDSALAGEITDVLEAGYRDLSDLYRHAPSQPITVLLYPLRAFRQVTQVSEDVAGLYDGKIRVPLGGLRRLDARASGVLLHELSHAVVHAKTRGTCPRWLQEGLAQRAEGRVETTATRAEVRRRLRAGAPETWESRGFSYPVALSLTRWLEADRGFAALVEVLERLGNSQTFEQAALDVYGQSFAALCRRWADDVQSEATR